MFPGWPGNFVEQLRGPVHTNCEHQVLIFGRDVGMEVGEKGTYCWLRRQWYRCLVAKSDK